MPIVRTMPDIDPSQLREGQGIVALSDQKDDLRAIWEVEQWCAAHGLWREAVLRLEQEATPSGRLRKVKCFKPTPRDLAGPLEASRQIGEALASMPLTVPSSELTEE